MSEYLNFQFFCPNGAEDRAIEILSGIPCVNKDSVGFNASAVTKITFDKETGFPIITKGFGIIGQALPSCVEEIVNALSNEQIAGYSRDSQVVFLNPDEPPQDIQSGDHF